MSIFPGGIALDGIHFRARRAGNGQSRDRRRGERGVCLHDEPDRDVQFLVKLQPEREHQRRKTP